MTFFNRKRVANSEANKYASAEDFRRVFSDDRDMLHRLSFLLTGDHEKAEQCFVAGLEDSSSTNGVFKEWARTWAKRTIIQDAIAALKPRPPQYALSSLPKHAAEVGVRLPSIADRDLAIRSVLALESFERFVFVITVLEGYSEHQCALLLNTSLREVYEARDARRTRSRIAADSWMPAEGAFGVCIRPWHLRRVSATYSGRLAESGFRRSGPTQKSNCVPRRQSLGTSSLSRTFEPLTSPIFRT